MSSINERINMIVEQLFNGNVSAFARAIDVSQSTLKDIVGGRLNKPSYSILEKISSVDGLNISLDWLIAGKGEMLKSQINVGNIKNVKGNISGNVMSAGGNVISIPNFGGEKIIKENGEVELCSSAQSTIEKLEIEKKALQQRIADLEKMIDMKDKLILML